MTLQITQIHEAVQRAFAEDLGRRGDLTTEATVGAKAQASASMVARERGVVAGLQLAEAAFGALDPTVHLEKLVEDGQSVVAGQPLCTVQGSARTILTAERVALNFVGHLSGIASLTAAYVAAVKPHPTQIVCTRKTLPGLRSLQKYAVRCGGGFNHRFGLDDAILIKDNHIAIAGGIRQALQAAKKAAGHLVKIEIEVDTLTQLEEVLDEGVDVILLDNMSIPDLAAAVTMTRGRALLEASGNMHLDRVHEVAATGVQLISVGALTHSVKNLDIGLDINV